MTDFQTTVNLTQGFGVQGEIIYDGPIRSAPWQLISTPQANVIGATAYTATSGQTADGQTSGIAQAGGSGAFVGILANPKVYTNTNGSFTATLTLADDTIAELVTMGQMLVKLTTAANPGDLVQYDNTTGALSSIPPVATFTASNATSVLTVTATDSFIGPGLIFVIGGDAVTIVSNGTGVGGTGTYNLSVAVGTVASAAFTSRNVLPGSGKTLVPRCKVILRASAANALAMVELTN